MLTLHSLSDIPRAGSGGEYETFRRNDQVSMLDWPDDVLRDWLWDHGRHVPFLEDYGSVDLTAIRWTCEAIATATLVGLPTGSREAELMAEIAQNHEHWIGTRDYANPEVRSAWEQDGTWVRRPILLDRSAIHPDLSGLQVVEGHTRFGILRGHHAVGIAVAPTHSVWVGRPVHSSGGK